MRRVLKQVLTVLPNLGQLRRSNYDILIEGRLPSKDVTGLESYAIWVVVESGFLSDVVFAVHNRSNTIWASRPPDQHPYGREASIGENNQEYV